MGTGQYSNVPDFGLYYYNARWYDGQLGRFAQADTIIPLESQGVQAWDRYAGMNNNPVRYSDPSGHCILDGCWWVAPIIIYGGAIVIGLVNEAIKSQTASAPVSVSPAPTSTPNPTLTAVQTQIGPPNRLVIPTPTAPGPILKAAPTATQTLTPIPTSPPLGDLVVEAVSEQINNYDPYEPSIFDIYPNAGNPNNPVDIIMGVGAAIEDGIMYVAFGNKIVQQAESGASQWWRDAQQNPYRNGTVTPTSSPTSTRAPTFTPSSTPTQFFRTPTATPR